MIVVILIEHDNDEILYEGKQFYYKCNRTIDEGIKWETCIENYVPNENGLCINLPKWGWK